MFTMDVSSLDSLTRAERACLRAALGRTNDQIARELGISSNTVKVHMANARRKLGNVPRGDAARALAAWENNHPFQASPTEVMAFIQPTPSQPDANEAGDARRAAWLPFRTGAHNDLNPLVRLGWIFGLAVLGAIGFGALASGARVISDLFR